MHIGIVMECDLRPGRGEAAAFTEAFEITEHADRCGIDSLWMVERHFAGEDAAKGTMGAGIPSVSSTPMVIASALAARTSRIRIGIGVSILPLHNPVGIAEDAAALDHICGGRLEFGVGRSMDEKAYGGFGIDFAESTARQEEALEIIKGLWTNETYGHRGRHYSFEPVNLVPRPLQQPHPPIWFAINRKEAFHHLGRMGYPILIGLRGMTVPQLKDCVDLYRSSWKAAGHEGAARVLLRAPIHVGRDTRSGQEEPRASTMAAIERQSRKYKVEMPSYAELLKDKLIYGGPRDVARRLSEIVDYLDVEGVIAECNLGGRLPQATIEQSLTYLGTEVRDLMNKERLAYA